MSQMARTNELDECCEFLSKMLLAYVFETTKTSYYHKSDGRGEIGVKIDKRWRWTEPVNGVKVCNWEEVCFPEKGEDDIWML